MFGSIDTKMTVREAKRILRADVSYNHREHIQYADV